MCTTTTGMLTQMQRPCDECGGQGNSAETKTERKVLEVHIEKGMKHNARIQFKGMADEMPGMEVGDVNFIVQDWVEADNTEAHYSGGQRGQLGVLEMQKVFTKNLDDLDAAGFDWSVYDSDNDGDLDGVVVFTTGLPAEMVRFW